MRQFIQDQLYRHLAAELPGPDPELRIDLAMAQLLGIAYLRGEPLASTPVAELIAQAVPAVEAHPSAGDDPR